MVEIYQIQNDASKGYAHRRHMTQHQHT